MQEVPTQDVTPVLSTHVAMVLVNSRERVTGDGVMEGRLIDTIETPERPTQLVFGGKDGKTLFIAARTSLYSVRTEVAGR